jgi:short-subunit dehydrogenase
MKKQYAVITGASSELGKAYAFELAKREINLILISLQEENLENTNQLKVFGIDVKYYETDLTSHQNLAEVAQWINSNFEVAMLINNTGTGRLKKFQDTSVSYMNTIMQLNVMSISLLTRALLPNLMRQRKSYILNVSGIAEFSPMGFTTVYPVSKAFVHRFTQGLYQELKNTSVVVSAVNPGPILENTGLCGRIGLLTLKRVAAVSIRQLFRKDPVIMNHMGNVINWLLVKIIQISVRLSLLTKAFERNVRDGSSPRKLEKS